MRGTYYPDTPEDRAAQKQAMIEEMTAKANAEEQMRDQKAESKPEDVITETGEWLTAGNNLAKVTEIINDYAIGWIDGQPQIWCVCHGINQSMYGLHDIVGKYVKPRDRINKWVVRFKDGSLWKLRDSKAEAMSDQLAVASTGTEVIKLQEVIGEFDDAVKGNGLKQGTAAAKIGGDAAQAGEFRQWTDREVEDFFTSLNHGGGFIQILK